MVTSDNLQLSLFIIYYFIYHLYDYLFITYNIIHLFFIMYFYYLSVDIPEIIQNPNIKAAQRTGECSSEYSRI